MRASAPRSCGPSAPSRRAVSRRSRTAATRTCGAASAASDCRHQARRQPSRAPRSRCSTALRENPAPNVRRRLRPAGGSIRTRARPGRPSRAPRTSPSSSRRTGSDVDRPHARVRLGSPHLDRAAARGRRRATQRERLTDPQPGEHERRDERAALAVPAPCGAVELAGARRAAPRCARRGRASCGPASTAGSRRRRPCARLRGDQLVLDGALEDRREHRNVLLIDVALSLPSRTFASR